VVRPLQEDLDVDNELDTQRKHYVRPVEINFLSVGPGTNFSVKTSADFASPSALWSF
jgi:hypothetical protein